MTTTKKRKPIGRRLDTAKLNALRSEGPKIQTYVLASGERAEFYPLTIAADELESKTCVDEMINIREQRALTPDSLSDITETLRFQQFFPVIGRKLESGMIEILDGSRRRAAAILVGKDLDLLVTDKQIDSSDAHALANAIQTAREHSIREIGIRLQAILEQTEVNQKELAKREGLSASKVTRALQAAKVPFELIELFPNPTLLAQPDYRLLLQISEDVDQLDVLVDQVKAEKALLDLDKPEDTVKQVIVKLIKACANPDGSNTSRPKDELHKLWEFNDPNAHANIRRRRHEREVKFEFKRLPQKVEKRLEKAILSILEEHYGEQA